ncbi:methyltransferase [Actinomadura oligospora]|uniref:methyltransferase n=1 Tax=Actinomadura oligospora TaxID=111804 RepID=UPI000479C768|nr:methyltransferase [Actinomadura oligospora]
MTQTQVSQVDPQDELRAIYVAHYRFQYLSAAFEFGLFSVLAEAPGLTRAEIAGRLGLEEQPARILLLGLTAFGLVRKDGDRYSNSAITEPLASNTDQVPAAFIPYHQHITYRSMGWFHESLKKNTNVGLHREFGDDATTLYARLATDPGLERAFHNAMGGFSQKVSDELAATLDLSSYAHVLDVGGGTAVNATKLARRWPHLRVTILDLPTVAEEANARSASAGLGDRVRAIGLDAFGDEFPEGDYDCVLFAHFLEIWSVDRIRAVVGKAARAAGPNAGMFVVTPFQDDAETGPQHAAELSAYFHAVASGEGMVYTPKEYESWMSEAGFRPAGRAYVNNLVDHIVISGVKSGDAGRTAS